MVLVSMEMTITSTAMPTIIGELHGLEHYSWVASIYLLACTVTMPLYGRMADALGRKRVVMSAIAIFCVASLLASQAQTMTQLIAFRGLQGLGAGGVMPVVLTILGDIFTLEERARIQGFARRAGAGGAARAHARVAVGLLGQPAAGPRRAGDARVELPRAARGPRDGPRPARRAVAGGG